MWAVIHFLRLPRNPLVWVRGYNWTAFTHSKTFFLTANSLGEKRYLYSKPNEKNRIFGPIRYLNLPTCTSHVCRLFKCIKHMALYTGNYNIILNYCLNNVFDHLGHVATRRRLIFAFAFGYEHYNVSTIALVI